MLAQIVLRRRPLERGKAQHPVPVEREQQAHGAVAQNALAVVKQHGPRMLRVGGPDRWQFFRHAPRKPVPPPAASRTSRGAENNLDIVGGQPGQAGEI